MCPRERLRKAGEGNDALAGLNNLVYATSNYSSSARSQAQITLATDNVFSHGASLELATVTGDVTSGMIAALTVAV